MRLSTSFHPESPDGNCAVPDSETSNFSQAIGNQGFARRRTRVRRTRKCDRHGHELAGESPAIALERREYVGEGKGARRNSLDLPSARDKRVIVIQ